MKVGKQIAILVGISLLAVAVAVAVVWFGNSKPQTKVNAQGDLQTARQNTQTDTLSDSAKPPDESRSADPEPTGDPETDHADDPGEQTADAELLFQSLGNGNCMVVGPGGVRDACVVIPKTSPAGEKVVKIASRAFFGCEWITALQIPETVKEIGDKAFADCKNLVYISVSAQNPVYCDADGVLYTADKRVLLQYPPMRAGEPLVLPASLTAVSEMAFYGAKNLKTVLYQGSGEDWERIEIGARNFALYAAAITFGATGE